MCIRGWASRCVTEIRGNCVAGLHIAVRLSVGQCVALDGTEASACGWHWGGGQCDLELFMAELSNQNMVGLAVCGSFQVTLSGRRVKVRPGLGGHWVLGDQLLISRLS